MGHKTVYFTYTDTVSARLFQFIEPNYFDQTSALAIIALSICRKKGKLEKKHLKVLFPN